jgi:hypothetical protein
MMHVRARVRFTPGQLKKKVNQATFKSLGQAAGTIRLTAKRSIRKRKKPSNPGSPPSSPTGMLRRVLRYEVNRDRGEAVIGPVNEIAGRLWNLHEFGGVVTNRRKLKRDPCETTRQVCPHQTAHDRPSQPRHTTDRRRKRTPRCQ